MKYYLAIDIGASSGRHILAHIEDEKLVLEEIYRFENGISRKDGHLCWNHDRLFEEIINGLKKCSEMGKIPCSVAIDTWGVDFVLLDSNGEIIGNTVSYRDERTKGMDALVYNTISEEELYKRTGIQKALYNTIYQLEALKNTNPEQLTNAHRLLFTPDYFAYKLCGVMANEYTISTTSQLINPVTRNWDYELIDMLGLPKNIFGQVVRPGTRLGAFTQKVQELVGFSADVIAAAGHDTACAVLAVPALSDNTVYISSGTWSLMGVELKEANCSTKAMEHNLTNEGGYGYRYRFLKNIMGMWMIQSVKKESNTQLGFDEICKEASKCSVNAFVDCYDERFLAPESMTEEIKKACIENGYKAPENLFETASVIYNSLAKCYADTIKELSDITKTNYDSINIVGGGSNAAYLNELTHKYTGCTVYAGPGEGTAIGNVAIQMLEDGLFANVEAVRRCIYDSFAITKYN